jgi:hypothetical protein
MSTPRHNPYPSLVRVLLRHSYLTYVTAQNPYEAIIGPAYPERFRNIVLYRDLSRIAFKRNQISQWQ